LGGLAVNGKLIMIRASDEPLELSRNFFLFGHRSVVGWLAGSSIDGEDMLSFSASSGVVFWYLFWVIFFRTSQ
jgi:D-arabinose 1-dehydrogenase-like Zn-dependent alcohol dehydrogenase